MKKAFTLIELLLVISIIALLSSIVITNLRDSKLKAESSVVLSSLRQIVNLAELYKNDNEGYYPIFPITQSGTCTGIGGFFSDAEVQSVLNHIIKHTPNKTQSDMICYVSNKSWVILVKVHNDTITQNLASIIFDKLGIKVLAQTNQIGVLAINEEGRILVSNDNDDVTFNSGSTLVTFNDDTSKFDIDLSELVEDPPEPDPVSATCARVGSGTVNVNTNVTFNTTASGGTGSYTYTWYLNNVYAGTGNPKSIRINKTGSNTIKVNVVSLGAGFSEVNCPSVTAR